MIVLHGLEEAGNPQTYLREIWRVTAPEGRIVLAASVGLDCGRGRPARRSAMAVHGAGRS
ncbi:MAG: hypothetical protein R3C08_13515 [Hyphomonas sp.]